VQDTVQTTDTARPARHSWVPFVAAAAGASLLLKAVLIIASGNSISDGPMGVLYLGGLLLGLAAAIGAGLRRSGVAAKVGVAFGAAVLLLLWIMGLGDSLKPVIGAFSDAQHVKDEVPVGTAGMVLLGLAWLGFCRDARGSSST
jgi:hypothetical protein